MKKILKKIRSIFNSINFDVHRLADKKNVLKVIQYFKPYDVGINLVRFGGVADGGYLIPDDLKGIEACFSPGSNYVFGFEEDCFKKGMKVFIADKTVNPIDVPEKFHFTQNFIGCNFQEEHISMEQWVAQSQVNPKSDLLLQMDIEGAEYQNILSMSEELLNRFRIIVIEFHDLDKLFLRPFLSVVSPCIQKLLKTHTCVHLHPNNTCGLVTIRGVQIPLVIEATFLRKDRIKTQREIQNLPHPFDADCTPNIKPLVLPKIWYR